MRLKDMSGFLDEDEDLEDQELKELKKPEELEELEELKELKELNEPEERTDPLKLIVEEQLASQMREAEEKTKMIPDIVERGVEILRNSEGYYKLSFMGVLEKEFPMVNKPTVRRAVSEMIKRDDVEITTSMRMAFVGANN